MTRGMSRDPEEMPFGGGGMGKRFHGKVIPRMWLGVYELLMRRLGSLRNNLRTITINKGENTMKASLISHLPPSTFPLPLSRSTIQLSFYFISFMKIWLIVELLLLVESFHAEISQ